MRILCCLDGTNIAEISHALSTFLMTTDARTIGLLYVTDRGPHEDIGRLRTRHLRPHEMGKARQDQMQQADQYASQDILEEGVRNLPGSEAISKQGRPEREIVNYAAEWNADVIVICPRSARGGHASIGPKSVGHVARFVLDHAPCPVLLVRAITRNQFPLHK